MNRNQKQQRDQLAALGYSDGLKGHVLRYINSETGRSLRIYLNEYRAGQITRKKLFPEDSKPGE